MKITPERIDEIKAAADVSLDPAIPELLAEREELIEEIERLEEFKDLVIKIERWVALANPEKVKP